MWKTSGRISSWSRKARPILRTWVPYIWTKGASSKASWKSCENSQSLKSNSKEHNQWNTSTWAAISGNDFVAKSEALHENVLNSASSSREIAGSALHLFSCWAVDKVCPHRVCRADEREFPLSISCWARKLGWSVIRLCELKPVEKACIRTWILQWRLWKAVEINNTSFCSGLDKWNPANGSSRKRQVKTTVAEILNYYVGSIEECTW